MYLTEMQVQMVDISSYHRIESHAAAFVVNPVVVELGLINRADDMADVLIIVFQQHHKLVPILMLIILEFYPQVVVLGVVWEYEHTHLRVRHGMSATRSILEAHHSLMVVGCLVDEMAHEHFHRAVLTVSLHTHLLLSKGKEHRYLAVHDLVDTINYFLIVHNHEKIFIYFKTVS